MIINFESTPKTKFSWICEIYPFSESHLWTLSFDKMISRTMFLCVFYEKLLIKMAKHRMYIPPQSLIYGRWASPKEINSEEFLNEEFD